MNTGLYVGNLDPFITEEYLKEVFSVAGKVVDVKFAKDRETGRSRGFAFVTMDSEEAALSAVKMLQGSPSGRDGGMVVKVDNKHITIASDNNSRDFQGNRPPRR